MDRGPRRALSVRFRPWYLTPVTKRSVLERNLQRATGYQPPADIIMNEGEAKR